MEATTRSGEFWAQPNEDYLEVLQGISELREVSDNQKMFSVAQVSNERAELVKQIFLEFTALGAVLERHEATIHKRWLKKTKDQRRVLILRAWNNDMAPCHRPEWNAFHTYITTGQMDGRKATAACMWPYINQEDLVKPRSLLLFLESRGKNHPSEFAAADLEAMRFGRSVNFLNPGHLPHYAMKFTGRKNISDYGELVHIGTRQEARGSLVNRGVPVSAGILILRAQSNIMKFLQNCYTVILRGISANEIPRSPALPPPALSAVTDTGFASLEIMAAEAAYRIPAHIDLDRMVSSLASKRDQVADHLWSLKEDPAYFQEYVHQYSEHRFEMLQNKNGLLFLPAEDQEVVYWERVLRDTVSIDYIQLEVFTELHTQAEALRQMCNLNAKSILPEADLPEAYMHALLKLRYFLNEAVTLVLQSKFEVFASPPWRDHLYLVQLDKQTGAAHIEYRQPSKLNEVEMRLYRYLSRFAAYRDRYSGNQEPKEAAMLELKFFGVTMMIDELQRYIESEPQAKSMITPFIASALGDLAIVSECLHQLEIYQPWASTFDAMLTEDRIKSFRRDIQGLIMVTEIEIVKALDACDTSLGRSGKPTKELFFYPIAERRTEGVVAALRKAEHNLDAFWKQVNTPIWKALGPVKKTATHRFLTQPRSVQRTPPWVEPSRGKPLAGLQSISTSFAELELDRRRLTEQTTIKEQSTAESKVKTKTRGAIAQFGFPAYAQDAHEPDTHDNTLTFAVDARALKVFKVIFFTPSISATPGDIKWTDFLHAMASTGFKPEKLYGSVWHFNPSKVELKRSINFHEPHKEGQAADKIPYHIARGMGRRLNRAYGWDGSKFSLAEK